MASPIKPPGDGAPPSIGPVGGSQGSEGVSKSTRAPAGDESFQATFERVGGAAAPGGIPQAPASDEIQQIAAALQAGEMDAGAVVERLVARALESPAAQALTEVGQAELEAQVRDAIATDPALQALVSDLG